MEPRPNTVEENPGIFSLIWMYLLPSVLWHCWFGGRKGIWCVKNGGWWRWALVSRLSPDGVAPSRMVDVSASANLPLHHKVQKFSGTGSPGWSWKKGRKAVVVWWCGRYTVWVSFMNAYTGLLVV